MGTIGPMSIADVRRPSLCQGGGGWAIRVGAVVGGQRAQSEGVSEGVKEGVTEGVKEGTHAPSEVESIATPRAFVWRIGVRSSQVAGRLIQIGRAHV